MRTNDRLNQVEGQLANLEFHVCRDLRLVNVSSASHAPTFPHDH